MKNLSLKKLAGIVLLGAMLGACSSNGKSNSNYSSTNSETMNIMASGKYAVPPVDGTGSAYGLVTLDKDSGALSGQITVSNLSGPVSAAHIHQGLAGESGGILVTLEVDSANANQFNVPDGTVLDASAINALLSAQAYVNVHTTANPAGEVRGQIAPSGYQVIRSELKGENEVPNAVATGNQGIGYVTVNTNSGAIQGSLKNSGLDDATAAHIHSGFAGNNGGIVVGLMQDSGDTTIWKIPVGTTLNTNQLVTLMDGGMYFNIHTPANPSGEVRAQIAPENIHIARTVIDGSQQVPAVSTSASGVGFTTVNTETGAIIANSWVSNLVPTAGHIHMGAAGSTGGIVLALTQDSSEPALWTATGTLDSNQLMLFNNDELYYNFHSDAHPAGEIRGQIDG